MHNSIYPPAEDSHLMSRILKQKIPELLEENPDSKIFGMGAGSGIHLQTALDLGVKKQNILSGDINENAVSHCSSLGFNCVQTDLFKNISGKYDIIIFNPPYLPRDKENIESNESKIATTGGKKGNEIIIRFLKQAKNYLKPNGKIFLITSSLAKEINFKNLEYKFKELGCEKLFFERLCIWELSK